jgi:diaminohydroxyphosphoribosylaminopyrimidine deaminase/5-amino-6-(5-phosphoribosylamino)uracil reductase
MVGTNTAFYDNPTLNTREWIGKNPLRIVIDKHLRLSNSLKILDGSIPSLCYNLHKNETIGNLSFIKLQEENFIHHLIEDLYQKKIQSVIIEGGANLLQSFIQSGIWDEARVFESSNTFQNGIAAPQLTQAILFSKEQLLNDQLNIFVRQKN